jgi:ADP-heptose:LPS heptosyltransferase
MHMAGALNTPTVALFGPSDPVLWSPLGGPSITISAAPMECMPCDQKSCPHEGDHCMTHIEIDEVKLAIKRLNVLV